MEQIRQVMKQMITVSEDKFNDKFVFFLSDNGVWLTDNVPTLYLKKHEFKNNN
jgi:RNA:NAD 2'-phosphotransferase (TPT1/KptA family)